VQATSDMSSEQAGGIAFARLATAQHKACSSSRSLTACSSPPIVAIGGFDQLLAAGLSAILDDGTTVVVSADRVPPRIEPNVLVLADAILYAAEPLAELRARHPDARLLIVAPEPSRAYGRLSLACGASCIAANAPVAAIRCAVDLTAGGQRVFIGRSGSILRDDDPDCPGPLTARETQILMLLVRGVRYAGIAHVLELQVDTAKKYGARLRGKLNVQRSQELVGLPLALLSVSTHHGSIDSKPGLVVNPQIRRNGE
jgi:DNA-binding NarL/FixJ family response regulator